MEQLWPRSQTGSLDDAIELRPQIAVPVSIASDDMLGTGLRLIEGGFEIETDLGEQRNDSRLFAFHVFGFHACDVKASALPIHIMPGQCQRLGRATQPTEATQREEKSPFVVRAGVKNLLSFIPSHEVIPQSIGSNGSSLHVIEGTPLNQPMSNRRTEELFRATAPAPNSVLCIAFADQLQPPRIRITRIDLGQALVRAEVVDEVSSCLVVGQNGGGLHIAAPRNVVIEKSLQSGDDWLLGCLRRIDQTNARQPVSK